MSCSSLDWSHKSLSPAYKCCRLICLIKVEAPWSIQTSLSLNYGYDSLLKVVLCVVSKQLNPMAVVEREGGKCFWIIIWPSDDLASQSFRDCFSQIRFSSLINCYHLSNIIQHANNVFSTFHCFKHLRKKSRPTSPGVRHDYHLGEKPDVWNHAKEVEGAQNICFFIPLCPALAESLQAE